MWCLKLGAATFDLFLRCRWCNICLQKGNHCGVFSGEGSKHATPTVHPVHTLLLLYSTVNTILPLYTPYSHCIPCKHPTPTVYPLQTLLLLCTLYTPYSYIAHRSPTAHYIYTLCHISHIHPISVHCIPYIIVSHIHPLYPIY